MSSPTADTSLLDIGKQCAAEHCDLHDYLPYKCQFCSQSYCSDHFRPAAHKCEKYASTDRIAPPCPFCQTPISIRQNEDPNLAMETHFATSCKVLLGSDASNQGKTPKCSRNRCGKVLYDPITCDRCSKQFCASHRHPDSHSCAATPIPNQSSSSSPNKTPAKPRLELSQRLRQGLQQGNSSSPSTSSSVSSPKKQMGISTPKSPVKTTTAASSSSTPSSSKPAVHNPFSKTDRSVPSSPVDSSSPVPSIHSSLSGLSSSSTSSSAPETKAQPEAAGVKKADVTQAIIEERAEKPKPHLLFSSFAPPSLFGAA